MSKKPLSRNSIKIFWFGLRAEASGAGVLAITVIALARIWVEWLKISGI